MRTALLLSLLLFPLDLLAAPLQFRPETVAGMPMQLPQGWQRQQDDYSLILTESSAEHAPVLGMIAMSLPAGSGAGPLSFADSVLQQLDLPSQGIRAVVVDQRQQPAALYRLHRLDQAGARGYLATFTYVDTQSGAAIHLFFSALEQDFVAMGGPMLPLVSFGGQDPRRLQLASPVAVDLSGCGERGRQKCASRQWSAAIGDAAVPAIAAPYLDACGQPAGSTDCAAQLALASQISRLSHESSMQILYNMDNGWCREGEPGCD